MKRRMRSGAAPRILSSINNRKARIGDVVTPIPIVDSSGIGRSGEVEGFAADVALILEIERPG